MADDGREKGGVMDDAAKELLAEVERELLAAAKHERGSWGERIVVSATKAPAALERALSAILRAKTLKGVRW